MTETWFVDFCMEYGLKAYLNAQKPERVFLVDQEAGSIKETTFEELRRSFAITPART